MNIKILTIVLTSLVLVNCEEPQQRDDDGVAVENAPTPEVLEEDADYEFSSLSKRYDNDIISKLYREALEKDEQLNKLNEAINEIGQLKIDSTADFKKYIQTNNEYWSTASYYLAQLSDSTVKKATREIFKTLESDYRANIATHMLKEAEINQKAVALKDQLILMKLFVTIPMMKNYQANELPPIEALDRIITEYDSLIEETKKYTEE